MRRTRPILLLILILFLVGCSTPETQEATQQPTAPIDMPSGYPAAPAVSPSDGYPATIQEQQPSYADYITPTPNPAETPIIVRVEHQDGVEAISVINISSEPINVGAYMIFSPVVQERIIIPVDTVLNLGEKYTVYNGANESFPAEQRWLAEQVVTNALDEIWLTNMAGRVIFFYVHYPAP